MIFKIKINKSITLIIKNYILAVGIFSIFRFILFLTELERINFNEEPFSNIVKAFIMGIRFDIVISGYILFIPAIILLTFAILQIKINRILNQIIFYWIFILFTIAFIIATADIPYFNQFYERFSVGAFEWIDNLGFVASMIIQEPRYILFSIPFLVLDILFFILLKKIFKDIKEPKKINIIVNIFISLIFLFVLAIGIRGRIQKKSPIRIGTAYFCENSFLNKLGLNPVFTLINSYLESQNKAITLINNEIAEKKIKQYLNLNKTIVGSPIARIVNTNTISTSKPNIIIIIMESMTVAKMSRFGNQNKLTPFLDSLSYNSIFFDNFYSAGKHTFNGVFSTLFSFPALYRQHPLKQIRKYDGLASTLLKSGYSTTYITTHDSQFDNIEGFLRANDFQNIISQSDYPISEIKTTLGVPDDFMFRYSIPEINKLSQKEQAFFVTFMTASDHGPYYIPEYFRPKTKGVKNQIVEYADWSLRQFITLSSKEKWFNNTIFIFVADHGAPINTSYEISLNYFHIPFVIYAPKILKEKKTYKKMGSQIDIFPTIMGLIKIPFINNTLGIDLLKETREYVIINDDDKIGIIDSTYFCIMKNEGKDLKLYKYRKKDKTDYFNQNKEKAIKMSDFAKVNMQITQEMILNKETTLHK